MRRALWVTAVALAVVLGATLAAPWARSQSAPQLDPDETERIRQRQQQRVEDAVREAREGKYAVIEVDELRLGPRELTRVSLEGLKGRTVALVPEFRNRKTKRWAAPEGLVKALKDVPRGYWEEIHLEESLGVLWVVGVGADSPDSLRNLERDMAGRTWSAEPGEGEGNEDAPEPVTAKAIGRFIEIGQGTIEGTEARVLVIERGVAMTRQQFWLVDLDRRGNFRRPARNVIKVAESLTKGQRVEIVYTRYGTFHLIESLKVVE